MSIIKINIKKKYKAKHFYPKKKKILTWLKSIFKKKVELNIVMIKKSEMKKLNFKYKDKNYPTNILTFAYKKTHCLKNNFIGEIIICNQIIYEESLQKKKTLLSYWASIIIHGALHLLYNNNSKNLKIKKLEKKIMYKLGYKNFY
ncbi:rRNA maturation RNase YbeY [Buchnera aphidicola (Pseudoregma panicola)]|uniref:rRNA maturation RNase YbeY n=1 Tax=Buchnera aphidicola TaxID=9 RepID=UPI0031B6F834